MGGSFSSGGRIALGATASGSPERRRLVNPRHLVFARSCGASGRSAISLARFLRFPAGFPRGRLAALLDLPAAVFFAADFLTVFFAGVFLLAFAARLEAARFLRGA